MHTVLLVTAMQVQYVKLSLQVTYWFMSHQLGYNLLSGVKVVRKISFIS